MRTYQISDNIISKPLWLHDEYANYNLLPNGAILKASSVPLSQSGKVYSGNLVGRADGMNKYVLIPANATNLSHTITTKLALDATATDTIIKVVDVDGLKATQAITVGGTTATIASVNKLTSTVTLTAALGAARTAGVDIQVTAAVTLNEVFLMATNILDADIDGDFTLLRKQRMIYQNKLPLWTTASAYYKTLLTQNYVCIEALA